MKLGLIGFPQVGKRTLFRLLTGQDLGQDGQTNAVGLARVRDSRFDKLVHIYGPAKQTPALMEFVLLPDLGDDPDQGCERGLRGDGDGQSCLWWSWSLLVNHW